MKKKGISTILATAIIVLLVTVSVAVVWRWTGEYFEGFENVKYSANLLDTRFIIVDGSVQINTAQDISFLLERVEGNPETFPIVVLKDSFGYSKVIDELGNIEIFETLRVSVPKEGENGHLLDGAIREIFVYPALRDEKGQIILADSPSDIYQVRESENNETGSYANGTEDDETNDNETTEDFVFLTLVLQEGFGHVVNESGEEYFPTTRMNKNQEVYLLAVPEENHIFDSWTEKQQQYLENPLRITMNRNRTIGIIFHEEV